MCLYPRLIQNAKYKPNKKNGGKPPVPTDPRTTLVPMACGNCIECRKQKSRQWQIRLLEEIRHNKYTNELTGETYPLHPYFITLTFSNQSIQELTQDKTIKGYTLDNHIATIAVRRFHERWRKNYKKSLRHWYITELGHNGTQNIHLHGIIWFKNKTDILEIDKYWQYGWVFKGTPIIQNNKIIDYKNFVNEQTVGYITKYVTKIDLEHKYYKPIILCSPGIGKQYTERTDIIRNTFKEHETKETYKTRTGHEIALPIYYRNKIYNENEREALWLHKLDKQERYVLGTKIDTSNGHDDYLNILQNARTKNTQLGYGNDQKDWDQYKYEQQIREQMQQTRITRAKVYKKIVQDPNFIEAPF
jgi:hypothetical protein